MVAFLRWMDRQTDRQTKQENLTHIFDSGELKYLTFFINGNDTLPFHPLIVSHSNINKLYPLLCKKVT